MEPLVPTQPRQNLRHFAKISESIKERAMKQKKKKKSDAPLRSIPSVVIHASVMREQREQRLSTAVDALLAEWVRQELSRINKS
jgi:hypothetical protein